MMFLQLAVVAGVVLAAHGQLVVKTVMEFSRELNTCDAEDQAILDQGTSKMVWATNDQTPVDENSVPYHTDRGTQSLNLVSQNANVPEFPSDVRTMDLVMDNVLANGTDGEPVDTLYYCRTYDLPDDRKRHIIAVEPLIDPRAFEHVHHFVLYICDDLGPHTDWEGACYDAGAPSEIDQCKGSTIFAGWAVGGTTEYFPADVGYPMGRGASFLRHVLLETHYDNPLLKPDIVDSSGLRLYYTDQIRPYDAGVMVVSAGSIEIPPREEAYDIVGYCSSDCSKRNLPPEGVHLFTMGHHAHLAGRAMLTQHIRDGVELSPIQSDPNYDFNYQQYAQVYDTMLLPGDEVIVTCTYNTMDRTGVTYGGISTRDEMCVSYLMYYPLSPTVNQCVSSPREDGQLTQICPIGQGELFTPQVYVPLPEDNYCADYEKPVRDRRPQRLLSFDPAAFDHTAVMDPEGTYLLHWTFSRAENVIRFAAEATTQGWAGLGLSPNGGMVGSDIFLGWQDAAGDVHFHDRMAFAQALPSVDVSQDLFDIRIGKFVAPQRNYGYTNETKFDYKPLD